MQVDDNIKGQKGHGRVLCDLSSTGKNRNWAERKMSNEVLACAYDELDPAKAIRLRQCSTVLTFREYEDGQKRLESMNSCRVRLCPICSWRRSLKCFYNTERVMERIDSSGKYGYIFLTLTLRNSLPCYLNATLDAVFEAWNRFSQLKRVKGSVKGWYRGLEITHDTDEFITPERFARSPEYFRARGLSVGDRNPNFNTYHPHLHCIFAVRKSYFSSRYYISKAEFAELWRQSLRINYEPIVDVKKVRGDFKKAVAEISKYAAKSGDYVVPSDWDLTLDSVRTLDAALARRRLIAYGGIMKQAFKELRLDDAESGDLVGVGEKEVEGSEYKLVSYFWNSGYRQYIAPADDRG